MDAWRFPTDDFPFKIFHRNRSIPEKRMRFFNSNQMYRFWALNSKSCWARKRNWKWLRAIKNGPFNLMEPLLGKNSSTTSKSFFFHYPSQSINLIYLHPHISCKWKPKKSFVLQRHYFFCLYKQMELLHACHETMSDSTMNGLEKKSVIMV